MPTKRNLTSTDAHAQVDGPNSHLSLIEEALWLIAQRLPSTLSFNVAIAVRFEGELDVSALTTSLAAIIERQEMLRTAFPVGCSGPARVITPFVSLDLKVRDLQHVPSDRRAGELEHLISATMNGAFDLAKAPLLRAELIKVHQLNHVLVASMPHIISDFWSVGLFMKELEALYSAHVTGVAPCLPKLTLQYADYVAWQTALLKSPLSTQAVTYWRNQLIGLTEPLTLARGTAGKPVLFVRADTLAFALSQEMVSALRTLSRNHGATLFMTVLAAFALLLSTVSGQTDVLIGVPISARRRSDLEGIIGAFVSYLPLRLDLSGSPTFEQLLSQTRRICQDAYSHPDVPYQTLMDSLCVEGVRPSIVPRVMLNMVAAPVSFNDLGFVGLKTTVLPFIQDMPISAELAVTIIPSDGELLFRLDYNGELFSAGQITGLFEHFVRLVSEVLTKRERTAAGRSLSRDDTNISDGRSSIA